MKRYRVQVRQMPTTMFGADPTPTDIPPDVTIAQPQDIKAYGAYVDTHVTLLDKAWLDWHDPSKWDKSAGPCLADTQFCQIDPYIPSDLAMLIQAELISPSPSIANLLYYKQVSDIGGFPKTGACVQAKLDAMRTCRPEFFSQFDAAEAWSKSIVADDTPYGSGAGWQAWRDEWKKFYSVLISTDWWLEVKTEVGPLLGPAGVYYADKGEWNAILQYHHELMNLIQKAKDAGLKNVPSPGSEPTNVIDDLVNAADKFKKVPTSIVESLLPLALIAGAVYIGVQVVGKKKAGPTSA